MGTSVWFTGSIFEKDQEIGELSSGTLCLAPFPRQGCDGAKYVPHGDPYDW